MALTFLKLTNRVLKALNEVELTDATFGTADGFCQEAKDSVNSAIFDIYTEEDTKWPFAWAQTTFPTVAGTGEYTLTSAATTYIWESFKILEDVGNDISADHLGQMDYDTYNKTRWAIDNGLTTDEYGKPSIVVRKPDNNLILTTVPDKAYTIQYDYYSIPTELIASTDTVSIPDPFEQVIVDRALHHAYMFRDNAQSANIAQGRYTDNVNKMRRILIPQFTTATPLGYV